jgi:hypothetical protein
MTYKMINSCPVCSSTLKATRLECGTCGTVIKNEFALSKFEQLSQEQLKFVEIFIKNSGSIKDVEKEMGISYPTVKGKLHDVIRALGFNVNEEAQQTTGSVIDELERGEISAEEALNKISNKRKI